MKYPLPRLLSAFPSLGILLLLCLLAACSPSRRLAKNKSTSNANAAQALQAIFQKEKTISREDVWFADVRPAAQQVRLQEWQALQKELDGIDPNSLVGQDKINYAIFSFILDDRIKRIEFEDYLLAFNAEGGFFTELTFRQRNFGFKSFRSYQDYLEMLGAFKGHMERNIKLLRIGMEKGMTQPKVITQKYRALIDPFLKSGVEESFFYEPFTRIPSHITENGRKELQSQARQIIRDSVLQVYQVFDRFMANEYLPACRESLGAIDLPRGEAYYAHLVYHFATMDINADAIFEMGKMEVARIEQEMQDLIVETEFSGSFADFLHFLRTDPQFYAKTPEELLMRAAYLSKKIDGLLPDYFYKLPRLPYGVQAVPADIAPNYTGGRYSPGSVAGNRAGHYWVNTYKLESRPLYVLPALTLHEAVPGHHLQIALAQELEQLPDFRRDLYLSSYGEGWALYCEWLGTEMGIYESPYDRFGRLTYEMWRACRLVVDVGLHAKGWTREQAVEYMASRTALSLHEVNTEIDRYIGWPGQALSYKLGELKIRELRTKATNALRSNFDLRDFHDLLLENGSVPLFVLEEMVDTYIVANGGVLNAADLNEPKK